MNTYKFQHYIGGTAACKEIIMKDTKGCGQLYSNETLFYDIWFNGVKKEEEENAEVLDYYGSMKTSHKGFFLTNLE